VRYMLLICGDDQAHRKMEEDDSFVASCHAWAEELRRRGMLVTLGGLTPTRVSSRADWSISTAPRLCPVRSRAQKAGC
jgi:hypothetical protein